MLWPFALKAAADRHNSLNVDEKGVSPSEKFANVLSAHIMADEHTWGCPVYVLDHRLQDRSGGIPKWDPRARVGINLGRSSVHAGNVHLILNPRTGHVSPQFHVVFDDDFSTVPFLRDGTVPPFWAELVKTNTVNVTDAALPDSSDYGEKDLVLDVSPMTTNLAQDDSASRGSQSQIP
eukprot:3386972-Ditylum_brightwellii.AAC.1